MHDYYELLGVASRDSDKAHSVANQFGGQAYYGYDSLLDDERLDAVYVPLPNSMHYDIVKKAINNGVHVLVEKSIGCSFREVKELNDLAKKSNVVLIENFQFRFHRQMDIIKNILLDGDIGELRCMRSSFGFPPFADADNIRYKKILGGGSLLDAGAYPVKITQVILGDEITVATADLKYNQNYEVDFWGTACLKSEASGVISQIAFGFDNFYQCCVEIWGSKGRIFADRVFTAPPLYAPKIIVEKEGADSLTIRVDPDNHFINMLRYFYEMIVSGVGLEDEYKGNLLQSKIIENIRAVSNGK